MSEQFERAEFKDVLDTFAHVKRFDLTPADYEAWYISPPSLVPTQRLLVRSRMRS